MNNTNDINNRTQELPPLPRAGETGPQVCAIIRLYLAVIDDLTPAQVEQISEHVTACADCSESFEALERVTRRVGSVPGSAPSARVDSAIYAMMRDQPGARPLAHPQPVRPTRPAPHRRAIRLFGELAAAAVIVLALFASTHIFGLFGGSGTTTAFALPANLSWSQYVIYHSETRVGSNGELYQVSSYDDLSTGMMHVETTMDGQLNVVAVGNAHQMVGLDTMHHVAQMNADAWSVDDSVFDLAALRHDLQTGQAAYLDTDTFKGQPVYRVRCSDGLVMLLDMHYLPVNVLRGAEGTGTGYPIYTTLKVMPSSQVPDSMWDMSVPPGYHMGTLPAQP
jgi:hypothetical protein